MIGFCCTADTGTPPRHLADKKKEQNRRYAFCFSHIGAARSLVLCSFSLYHSKEGFFLLVVVVDSAYTPYTLAACVLRTDDFLKCRGSSIIIVNQFSLYMCIHYSNFVATPPPTLAFSFHFEHPVLCKCK